MTEIAAYLDAHAADLAALLCRFVQIKTVNPPGENYDAMTALLVRELEAVGLVTRRFKIPRARLREVLPREQHRFDRYNVVGRWRTQPRAKTLHFNAHYDVVPASDEWSPFVGTVKDGWVVGRGTADMKGSIASLLLALRALRAARFAPRVNVEVSFTADEETDSVLGAEWLVRSAPISPDYAIVMEGGHGDRLCCGHNGVVWLEVIVHGKAVHGSRPADGINALEKMSALVLALKEHAEVLSRRTFRSPAGVVMHPTLNVGGVFSAGAGGKINTVPALARFSIDRRVLPNETVASAERELRAFLRDAARKVPKCRITVEKISHNHACFTEPSAPFFSHVAATVERVRRRPTFFDVSTGFNDMHFFAQHLKIPTAGYGPSGENHHGVNERARLRELVQCARIYAELLVNPALSI